MPDSSSLPRQWPLIVLLLVLLGCGFLATSLASYYAALDSIRAGIIHTELPLTSDNVYSEIQKDLVRPILISSMMSRDTFMRDWVMDGEQDAKQVVRYLREVQEHYATVTSFFVSEKTHTYYQAKGVLKKVEKDQSRDDWYFRVRDMQAPYEINVDIDMANSDRMTVFINYKVFDYQQRFIGATGVGLTVDAVVKLIDTYQQRYNRSVFLVDTEGRLVLTGSSGGPLGARVGQSLNEIAGLEELMVKLPQPQSGDFEYQEQGRGHFLNVRFIPELNWYLFVDTHEDGAVAGIRQSLYINLLICLVITALIITLVNVALRRYQRRISALATTDQLTELPNRRGFNLLANQAMQEARRNQSALCVLMLDLDNFKQLNDSQGHMAGDEMLRRFASHLRNTVRKSDIICRWGGEEFILLLKDTTPEQARELAEKIIQQTEQSSIRFNDVDLQITTSIGLAHLQADESLEQVITRADRALYRAKQSGRNRLCEETA
ncbi:sensor domain-containing diguanylate cyclase [Pseudomonas spirodelae]|uniref:diguanylate cyclase n=1 Tax=Pseudomonas spirodelae TaxID=3101751 RepID=A0ABU5P4F7_9PSED|nr:diguanylate cyclase [Pseudomonas sp. T5W1]MBU0808991.1 diguanylate cyclase [Gammaproteobacteria bacterium]MBU0883065.1 diguanylate cyclase [Gammaproteobacteria bacterium]MBU1859237.1 diguanylate cyclase [Gammaproteobacteria bacterium]MEA1604516.1 diguanylate cyclase [Pseudomonas sp. T5W1]